MPNGKMICDLAAAYSYFQIAKIGYEIEKAEGVGYHDDALAQVLTAIEDPCFEDIRTLYSEGDKENEEK